MSDNPVDRFLAAVEAGTPVADDVFDVECVLDATVPNWRFSVRGGAAVRSQLAGWYRDPGRFEELHRQSLPGGELVEFTLAWHEDGVPHACHQVHVLSVDGDRITADRAWCGGRWPAALLAEMAEAEDALA